MRTLGCHAIVVIKGKVRPVTCHEGSGGGGRSVPLPIFHFGARGGWMVNATHQTFLPLRTSPGNHCTGGWVGPRACLDVN